jgi:hypothetical protein
MDVAADSSADAAVRLLDVRVYRAAPACSRMILVPELSISNQRCAVAYFRPALYSSTLPPAATNAELVTPV